MPELSQLYDQRAAQGSLSELYDEKALDLEKDYPEFDMPFEPKFRQLKTAWGLMSTFSPERQVSILQKNYPELQFQQMRDGSVLVDGSAYGGNIGYLNKPGFSMRDVTQMAGQVALFTPAARVAKSVQAGATMLGNMARVGTASAGTQAAQDLTNQATYKTPKVGDIDKLDVAVAGGGGALFEPLSMLAARFKPLWQQTPEITEPMRAAFRRAAAQSGHNPEVVTDDVIRQFLDDSVRSTAGKPSGEFGIRYTRGQQAGNAEQLAKEDTLRHTQISPGAQRRMSEFDELQAQDVRSAVDLQKNRLGGAPQETPAQAAGAAAEGIQRRGNDLYRQVGEAYDEVGEAYVGREGLKGIADRIGAAIKPVDFVRDPAVAPSTAKAVSDYRKQRQVLAKIGDKLRPAHIRTLEALRRRLLAFEKSAGNPTDRAQMRKIVRSFDEGMDDAFEKALITGDDAALDAMKDARSLRRRYAELYQRQDKVSRGGQKVKDPAGDFIDRMMVSEPSPEQVANALYGFSKIGAKNGSLELAKRFKDILGKDSQEWAAVRQGAFLKLFQADVKGNYSGQKILSRLKDARIYGDSFMRELFTNKERALMIRLGNAIKRSQPDRLNPSGSGDKAATIAAQTLRTLLPGLGFSVGGPAGAIAGGAAAAASGFRGTMQAIRATKPEILRVPIPAGAPVALLGREQLSNRTPEGATARIQ